MLELKLKRLAGGLRTRMVFLFLAALLPSGASAQQLWFSSGDDLNVKGHVSHPDGDRRSGTEFRRPASARFTGA